MPDESERLFDAVSKFKHLDIVERLHLIPRSELVILKSVLDAQEKGGANPSVSQIARKLYVSPPAISRKLKTLREKQLIETVTDEDDRRNTYLIATEKGKAALQENFNQVTAFLNRALARMEPEEIDQFYTLFNKIYESMRAELDRTAAKKTTIHRERGRSMHV